MAEVSVLESRLYIPIILVNPFIHAPSHFANVYILVNFLSQVFFVFLLFLGMEMYANEVETKEKY